MQEFNGRHQFFYIRKIAFDKIHKFGQLAVLLFVSALYLQYLLDLLMFPISDIFFKFKYAVLQILVPAFQCFHLVTPEKRTHTFGYAVAASFSFSVCTSFLACLSSCSASASAFCSCNRLFSISRVSFFFFMSR